MPQAKRRQGQGLNHLGHEGSSGASSAATGAWCQLQQLAIANRIEPQPAAGVITQLYRDIAAHKPGQLSSIGLGTFVDRAGGELNACTTEEPSADAIGVDYLFYKTFPINVGIIRGTTADPDGNVAIKRGPHPGGAGRHRRPQLQRHRHRQVERIAERGSLNPRQVKIPGILVDCVIAPENHWQTFAEPYSAAFGGEIRVQMSAIAMAMSERKIMPAGRRSS
jgi:propionate CoA-transferase